MVPTNLTCRECSHQSAVCIISVMPCHQLNNNSCSVQFRLYDVSTGVTLTNVNSNLQHQTRLTCPPLVTEKRLQTDEYVATTACQCPQAYL